MTTPRLLLPLALLVVTVPAAAQGHATTRPASRPTAPVAQPAARAVARPVVARRSPGLPWQAGDQPPEFAGYRIGDRMATVRARLGAPVKVDTMGRGPAAALALTNPSTGTTAVVDAYEGLAILYVTRREAGALDEVRVGDSKDAVLARWGKPTTVEGGTAMWVVGHWVIVVELKVGDVVSRLGVGRVAE
jgi:hypothetical protein